VGTVDVFGDGKPYVITYGRWTHGFSLELCAMHGGKLESLSGVGYDE
jgi:hypothetical protein